jgi:hypothetical protein
VNGWTVAVEELYAERLEERELELDRGGVEIFIACDNPSCCSSSVPR